MNTKSHEDPVWELSSPGEAAMASVQPTLMLPDPPLSQPRRGSTAPTFDLQAVSECGVGTSSKAGRDLTGHEDPVWELSSFSEAAMASVQPTWMLPDPLLSQPRRGSTAPTFDLHAVSECGVGTSSKAERDLTGHADPVWELSSFSEAAMASVQPTLMLPDPPLSQPRRGSTAPTFDLHAVSECGVGTSSKAGRDLTGHADPVWELSSFSEAAMASVQPTLMLPDPPLSQPHRGSTAPTFDLHAVSECGVGTSSKAGRDLTGHEDPVWELSSFSEAAMASVQPTLMLPDPPLSQPRLGSTAPTFDLHALSECGVGMTMEKKNR